MEMSNTQTETHADACMEFAIKGACRHDTQCDDYEKTGHTATPWRVQAAAGHVSVVVDSQQVASMVDFPTQTTKLANAEFICRAINAYADNQARIAGLVAALQGLFDNCTMVHTYWGEGSNQKEANAAIEAARAALKLAQSTTEQLG
jgi:hypothetical protein